MSVTVDQRNESYKWQPFPGKRKRLCASITRETQILKFSRFQDLFQNNRKVDPSHRLTYKQRQNMVKRLTLNVVPIYGALLNSFHDYNMFDKWKKIMFTLQMFYSALKMIEISQLLSESQECFKRTTLHVRPGTTMSVPWCSYPYCNIDDKQSVCNQSNFRVKKTSC